MPIALLPTGKDAPPSMSSVGGMITWSEVNSRKDWWNSHPPNGGYNQNGETPDPSGKGYRSDCSGYASMCLHLTGSPNSSELTTPLWTLPITKELLQPGDLMIAVADNSHEFGHVVLFGGWADAAHTSYVAHEFGFGNAPLHHTISYPYSSSRTFKPYRYTKIVSNGTSVIPVSNSNPVAGAVSSVSSLSLPTIGVIALIAIVGIVIIVSQV